MNYKDRSNENFFLHGHPFHRYLLNLASGDAAGTVRVEQAIQSVLSAGVKTRDLGGTVGTKEFGEAVVKELGRIQ